MTNQDQINNTVWKACDTFRGTIDPTQYKDYILTMLFLKYISDVRKEKKDELTEKYKGNEERVARALKNQRFFVPDKCTFDYLYENRKEDQLGDWINAAFTEIESHNATKLTQVFRNIDFNSETNLGRPKDRNRRLKSLLEDFKSIDLRPSKLEGNDVIGDAYEYLLEKFAAGAGKKAGEFYTPKGISQLLAKLIKPRPGDRICDPTCGSGSLLIKASKEVGSSNFSLYGQEVNGSTYALARMNMFLHEVDSPTIVWGDTLNTPALLENDGLKKFDVVVANPPFSLDKWGAEKAESDRYERFYRGIPPKSKGDYAFICHMVATLEHTGRAGIIMPHGVLFRGSSEGNIRKQLIDENLLETVVGLPPNLFYGTSIPACILVFNKAKGDNTDVLFIDASKHFEPGKKQNSLRAEDIKKVVATYETFKNDMPINGDQGEVLTDKYAYRATLKEIADNDYNLNIPRYVDSFEAEAPVDLDAIKENIEGLKQELATVEEEIEGYLEALGV